MPLIKLDDMDVGEKSTFINLGLISMTAVLQSNFQIGDTAVVLGIGADWQFSCTITIN